MGDRGESGRTYSGTPNRGDIIDGEFTDMTEPEKSPEKSPAAPDEEQINRPGGQLPK